MSGRRRKCSSGSDISKISDQILPKFSGIGHWDKRMGLTQWGWGCRWDQFCFCRFLKIVPFSAKNLFVLFWGGWVGPCPSGGQVGSFFCCKILKIKPFQAIKSENKIGGWELGWGWGSGARARGQGQGPGPGARTNFTEEFPSNHIGQIC